jgi:hypothetical protein
MTMTMTMTMTMIGTTKTMRRSSQEDQSYN